MDNNSFKEYLSEWSIAPNLSNQNFHNKLIRSLALSMDVDVISVRSINKFYKHLMLKPKIVRENNIFWKYPLVKRSKIDKYLNLFKRIKKITMQDSEIVFVDVLNLSLLKTAIKYASKYKMKIIGVCTDSPLNISFLSEGYKNKLLALGRTLDGYIVLTEKIGELYNVNHKPYVCIDGVSELIETKPQTLVEGNYIYFGGSLMKEYGVYNLIDAFEKLERSDLKLVICGHHLSKKNLAEQNKIVANENVTYLGALPYEENIALEKGAILTVNPRPINEKIDEYSIPSKTLEFLSNGCLNVTVYNPLLAKHYEQCIVWAKTGEVDDLVDAMKKALELNRTEREMRSLLGKNKVMQYTSLENVNKIIVNDLLSKLLLN